MDYMRSVYKTRMRLRADSDEETDVEWYFADKDAKPYPGVHSFGSLNWETEPENRPHEIGEVWPRVRTYSKRKANKHQLGKQFCGPPHAFEFGAVEADPVLSVGPDGVAFCCGVCLGFWPVVPPKFRMHFSTVPGGGPFDGMTLDLLKFGDEPIWNADHSVLKCGLYNLAISINCFHFVPQGFLFWLFGLNDDGFTHMPQSWAGEDITIQSTGWRDCMGGFMTCNLRVEPVFT